MDTYRICERLVKWFYGNERNLYWRNNKLNNFQWLVLEILLRRSRAEKVSQICKAFFNKYENPGDIIMISENELEDDLKSIGYNKLRCLVLKQVSLDIIIRFNGIVPLNYKDLCSIKNIGTYIASSFLCFHENIRLACIDTNVIRVISRIYGLYVKGDNRIDTDITVIVRDILPNENFKEFNYALIDLGGTICLSKAPKCYKCPLNDTCDYYFQNILSNFYLSDITD